MMIRTKFDDECRLCGKAIVVGDLVGWDETRGVKGVACDACTPATIRNSRPAPRPEHGPTGSTTSLKKPTPLGHTTFLKALGVLEDAVIERFTSPKVKVTPEMEKAWDRYSKMKALAMNPGTSAEGHVALKKAMLTILDIAL